MRKNFRVIAACALLAPMAGGCATKGFVRNELANQRREINTALDTTIQNERVARMMGDSAIRTEVAALRMDLQSLRTEFGARITAMDENIQFVFPVTFAFDDATVRMEDMPMLDRFAQVTQRYYPGSKVTVEGFADPAGSVRYNLDLSRRRAEAVRTHLLTRGLTDDVLRAIGYGEARQVNPGAERDDAGADQNRRVVFVVETRGQPASGVALGSNPN